MASPGYFFPQNQHHCCCSSCQKTYNTLGYGLQNWVDEQQRRKEMIEGAKTGLDIPIQLLSPNGKAPTRGRPGDAGLDIYAAETLWIKPGQRALVKTDIAMAIPPGYFGRLCGRSGLAAKSGIAVLGGILDETFRGEIKVILLNTSNGGMEESFWVKAGERIAQLIIEEYAPVQFRVVDSLDTTQRGESGFGSSGAT